jgi:hypothetical protein
VLALTRKDPQRDITQQNLLSRQDSVVRGKLLKEAAMRVTHRKHGHVRDEHKIFVEKLIREYGEFGA